MWRIAIAAVGLLVLSGPARAAQKEMADALAEYDKARPVYQARIKKIGIRPEDIKFDQKIKQGKRDDLGEAITEYLPMVQRAHFWLGGARRVDAERALQRYDMVAMGKEIELLRRKILTLWTPKCEWFRVPYNVQWKPLDGGSPLILEYFILQKVTPDYSTIKKESKEGLLRWLSTRHESVGLDYFGNRGTKLVNYKADKRQFSAYTMYDNAIAFWFYVKSSSAQKVKIKLSLMTKNDKLDEVFVNQDNKGKKKAITTKFKKGVNLVSFLIKNFTEQECSVNVRVEGKGLECAVQWPYG